MVGDVASNPRLRTHYHRTIMNRAGRTIGTPMSCRTLRRVTCIQINGTVGDQGFGTEGCVIRGSYPSMGTKRGGGKVMCTSLTSWPDRNRTMARWTSG